MLSQHSSALQRRGRRQREQTEISWASIQVFSYNLQHYINKFHNFTNKYSYSCSRLFLERNNGLKSKGMEVFVWTVNLFEISFRCFNPWQPLCLSLNCVLSQFIFFTMNSLKKKRDFNVLQLLRTEGKKAREEERKTEQKHKIKNPNSQIARLFTSAARGKKTKCRAFHGSWHFDRQNEQ